LDPIQIPLDFAPDVEWRKASDSADDEEKAGDDEEKTGDKKP
jgi:hypothetical protein